MIILNRYALGLTLGLALSSPARADVRDPAAAQALFDQARSLMRDGNYAEACPRLAESQRLDPGIGTLFHLADCYEKQGKLASAWATFLEVASLSAASGQPAREAAAKARAERLEPRVPSLKIIVPPASRIPGLHIVHSNVEVRDVQWDAPIPVDPGEHQVTASAPGKHAYVASVTIQEGTTATLVIPELGAPGEAPARAMPPAAAPPPARAEAPAPVAPSAAPSTSVSRGPGPLVVGLGVLGLASVGAGAILGLLAKSEYDDSKKHCEPNDENVCSARGVEQRDDAFVLGHLSTGAFVLGGLVLAGAGVLWLTSDDDDRAQTGVASVRVGLRGATTGSTLFVGGRF